METNSKNNVSSLIDIETNKLTEFIDQSIIKCMNSAIENNHLSKEKILFLSDNSLVPIKYEKNQSIFDYLFLKLKEYALFNILSNLTFSIDVKYHRLIPEAEGIARLLLSLNGKQYDSNSNPTDNITSASQIPIKNATTTKFKELNEILFNQESYISLLNSTTLKNRDVFENVYHNISTTIGNTLFINYLPFLYFEENIQTILGNPNLKHKKNDQRKLPITSSYFICNTCYNYYKPKNNKFYSVSETLLANLNNNNQIKTDFDSLVTNYNEDLRQYCSIFNELSKKKNTVESNLFYFYFSSLFSNNFFKSASNPIFRSLLNRINFFELCTFSANRTAKYHNIPVTMQKPIIEQLSKNEIPYDQIMYAYHLRILELMQKYNINLSQANIESFLSPFSDEDGNFKPSQSNTFIQLRNEIQINEQFINFLYDLLNQFNYEGDIFNIDYIFSTFKDLFSLDELCNNINSIITDLISNNYNTDGINEQELDFLLENKFLSTYLFKISVHNI